MHVAGASRAKFSYPFVVSSAPRVLLLENIHPVAAKAFADAGCRVATEKSALSEVDLLARLAEVDILGIRSKTQVTERVIKSAPHLLALGAFCIGTNQIAGQAAALAGVPAFNAPFSNTRSVAELVIAEIIALARQLVDRSSEVHAGKWRKVSAGCYEVRGKTLGIIGYGHIGRQVGVLAEALGMRVQFMDIASRLPMGNNRAVAHMADVLATSDFVTLHVPETPQTRGLIGERELTQMKKGAYLLNLSRGMVVDLDALAAALRSGRLAGAALDVYPVEPEGASDGFQSPVLGLANVILTPHVGGSTEEAQEAIGREVSDVLLKYLRAGATVGAVNFPEVEAALAPGVHRLANVHKNVPGVLRDITEVISAANANIRAQTLATNGDVGYLVMDVEHVVEAEMMEKIQALSTSIRTRVVC